VHGELGILSISDEVLTIEPARTRATIIGPGR